MVLFLIFYFSETGHFMPGDSIASYACLSQNSIVSGAGHFRKRQIMPVNHLRQARAFLRMKQTQAKLTMLIASHSTGMALSPVSGSVPA